MDSEATEATELYQVMKEYVQVALRILAEVCHDAEPHVLVGLDEWRRDTDGIFRLRDREEPFWASCIMANRDRLHSLDEYHRLVATLQHTPHIAPQIETLVGTTLGSRRVEIDHLTDYCLWRLPRLTGGLSFVEAQFNQVFLSFEGDLQRTALSHVVLAPLLGFSAELVPIRVDTDIEIDVMKDYEIVRCLSLGLLPDPFGPRRMADVRSAAAVRVRYDLEKRVGSLDRQQDETSLAIERVADLGIQSTALQRAMAVLQALRVFKDGRVSVPGLLQFSLCWPIEDATRFQYSNPGPMPWFNKYELAQNEAGEFPSFWAAFEQVTATGPLANAVRRFSYASDRERGDDRLVDLMIAAESLFLADIGAPQERGELRYRLAIRAAFFIDSNEYSKREIFKHMRRAYDVRSAIVHGGGAPDPELLKSPAEARLSLDDFTKLTEHLLRVALKKRIVMANATGDASFDWDALIMGS